MIDLHSRSEKLTNEIYVEELVFHFILIFMELNYRVLFCFKDYYARNKENIRWRITLNTTPPSTLRKSQQNLKIVKIWIWLNLWGILILEFIKFNRNKIDIL